MKILLAEDDEAQAEAIRAFLSAQRYSVGVVHDGRAAQDLAAIYSFDLALLDVGLPGLSGIEVCRWLRKEGRRLPVLLLTGRDGSADKVAGLDAGADDYLVKPCDLPELAARIRALLRRGAAGSAPVLGWGKLQFDPSNCQVHWQDQLLRLSPKEYSLLELFLRGGRRVYSRAAIIDHLWPMEEPPEEDTVKAHIKGLRHKLREAGAPADLIETVYGLGYRLKSPEPKPDEGLPAALAAVWERHKETIFLRLEPLEAARRAELSGQLSAQLRDEARQAAHKLTGSLGTFGLGEGSRLARTLEQALQRSGPLTDRFTTDLAALRRELERAGGKAAIAPQEAGRVPVLLAVDVEVQVWTQISAFAAGNYALLHVRGVPEAQRAIEKQRPDLAAIDLHPAGLEPGDRSRRWELVAALVAEAVPVLVLGEADAFLERVEAARRGSRAFVERTIEARLFWKVIQRTLAQRGTQAKVMIVDDDRELLAALQTLLADWPLELVTLSDPHQFWPLLASARPDLLVLDVEMPDISGVELCRIVRADPAWQQLPVLFLSAHTDAATVQRLWLSGADDYIQKPVSGADLAARILNRLDRLHAQSELLR